MVLSDHGFIRPHEGVFAEIRKPRTVGEGEIPDIPMQPLARGGCLIHDGNGRSADHLAGRQTGFSYENVNLENL